VSTILLQFCEQKTSHESKVRRPILYNRRSTASRQEKYTGRFMNGVLACFDGKSISSINTSLIKNHVSVGHADFLALLLHILQYFNGAPCVLTNSVS
jgi:hypothetical protein